VHIRQTLAKSEAAPFVCRAGRSLTGKARPAIPFAPDAAASTASHPNVRDDRDPPLLRDETARFVGLIWGKEEAVYFCEGDWTGGIALS
jgi:hypothetical protein